ncbi:PREDICTED: eIF-2-alpha kinase GCN2 isoform X3 [Ipomoea nil]|uniref:eIF-2-alpha kinase GCN2 isoform X3 n=1 Tax=Ipomoea nil TaxID=35883 RepID=UPI000901F40E|nr:PREDICTED: eIF-2-alpha kinase GCN2 isoform X3 [Ipomoea nil]
MQTTFYRCFMTRHEMANSNAREGRVMIYNLVEAAQEFLSELLPQEQLHESATDARGQLFQKGAAVSTSKLYSSRGPFVFGFIDLFSGFGESWHWSLIMEGNNEPDSLVHSNPLDSLKNRLDSPSSKVDQIVGPIMDPDIRRDSLHKSARNLGTLQEESDGVSRSSVDLSRTSLSDESMGNDAIVKNLFVEGNLFESDDGSDYCDLESEPSECGFSESIVPKQSTGVLEKDLILAHLLRLACAPKGALSDAMPGIISELCNLGFVSEQVRDLANKPSSVFNKTFSRAFQQNIVSSKIPQFWKASSDLDVQNPLSSPSSRYLNDFEELQPLGHGGFGHVVLCKNKLDGRQYAVKKIRLKDKNPPLNDHILREVATLSRLQHQHVVRYYQAWFETGISGSSDAMWGSRTFLSSSFSCKDVSSSDAFGNENKLESTYLYIQMEFCPRTLRQKFESYSDFDKDLAWHLFRQIVEGLAHIHGQGIIHRDLTPNNIFFGARNDIKIGDFGLAKFLKLEQLDQDLDAAETIGISVDGTGQVGTFFYTAPEIEQGWPKINEKADMYSLGVVFFELWHPFSTAMERHVILSDLIQKGELPPTWVAEFPEQESLLRRMMSSSPSDRPSATELLQHAFPPRMEYDLLDDMLRTIHTSDDTVIYDKIVSAVFNEEILSTKDHTENGGRLKISGNDNSSILFSDLETDNRDHVVEVAKEVFRRHCAKHLEIIHMRMLGDCLQSNRNTVKLLTRGGDMIELCHELRLPFVKWVIANQKSFFKRYEISYVYRRPIGHSPPNRYLQGDFDIVGGATALTEAEIIKVSMDIITHFFRSELCDVHLNHGDLLEAIWTWIGIKPEHRKKVAELISVLGSLRPQSSERKRKWVETRRQLRQELNLAETVLNRLQTVGLRFCVVADQALPRLRGALPADKSTHKALDEMSELFNYLRVWKLDKRVYVDALMPPTESYHRNLFFQIYLRANNSPSMEGTLLAIGGRYDHLFHNIGDTEYKPNTPGAVGTSLALETILQHVSLDLRPCRNDLGTKVLVCSRGGGGLLVERMELVAELWEENIKAEFVPLHDPSLTEQYEYANEHDIKCLVIITDTGVAQQGSVKVRHLELRKEKEIEKENLVRFLSEAMAAQFRNPSIWS